MTQLKIRQYPTLANIEFRVPYSQRYLFNAIPDTNHNASEEFAAVINTLISYLWHILVWIFGYPAEVVALFTTISSIRVSRVGRVRVSLTVTVRVRKVSVMVSVRDSVK